jgi:hypothetical protein
MQHTESRTLFAYWNGLRAGRPAPDRAEIEPREIAPVLGDTFILEGDATGQLVYRLAGSRICQIFARDMKGADFLSGFGPDDQRRVMRTLADAHAAQAGLLLSFTAATAEERSVTLEAAVLPLVHRGRIGARMIGCLSAAEQPYWMGRDPIVEMTLASARLIWPTWHPAAASETVAAPATVVLGARPALRVIQGGNAA